MGDFTLYATNDFDNYWTALQWAGTVGEPDRIDIDHPVIYPNPAEDYVHVQLPGDDKIASIEVSDRSGRLFFKRKYTGIAGRGVNVPVNNLKPGIYFLTVKTGFKNKTTKLIIR